MELVWGYFDKSPGQMARGGTLLDLLVMTKEEVAEDVIGLAFTTVITACSLRS